MTEKVRGKNPATDKITRVTVRCHGPLFTRLEAVASVLGPGFAPTTVARLAMIEGLPAIEARDLRGQKPQAAQQRPAASRAPKYDGRDEDEAAAALGTGDGMFLVPDQVAQLPASAGTVQKIVDQAVTENYQRQDRELIEFGKTEGPFGQTVVAGAVECPHGVRFDAFTPCQDCALMPPAPDVPEDEGDVTVINVGTEADPAGLIQ